MLFYKGVATFVRVHSEMIHDLQKAGYTDAEIKDMANKIPFYIEMREAIKQCSGEVFDEKEFESDMRYLINSYILADEHKKVGELEKYTLVELIVKTGINDAIVQKLNQKHRKSKKAVAETIINNLRKVIAQSQFADPRFYEEMSKLLDDLIHIQVEQSGEYAEFLKKAEELAKAAANGAIQNDAETMPQSLAKKPQAALLYRNLPALATDSFVMPTDAEELAAFALSIDEAMEQQAPDQWQHDATRERQVLNVIYALAERDATLTLAIVELLKHQ